uniref:ATPase family AAA domain-containing protein 5-like n=1 Tax=Rhipicephalus zambeziensis TaxID=60191 RepID=A0A224YIA3_9ACAR
MPTTQDNGGDRVRSLRPRKPRDALSDEKGSQNGEVPREGSGHRPARRRSAKSATASSKAAGKSEIVTQANTPGLTEGRLGSQAWTDKYKPSKSCPFVGNDATIAELRSWLSQWKNKPSNAERSNSRHSLSESEDSTDGLSNCYLLSGPPGVGKTSSVYYLAEELGFKVLEVHASSERPGKKILAELHEATQSHHVEGSRLSFAAVAAPSTPASANKVKVQKKAKSAGPLQQMFERAAAKSQEKTVKVVAETPAKKSSKGPLDSYFSANSAKKTSTVSCASNASKPTAKTSPKGTLLGYFSTPPLKKDVELADTKETKNSSKQQKRCSRSKGSLKEPQSDASDEDVEVVSVASKMKGRKTPETKGAKEKAVETKRKVKRVCSVSSEDDDIVMVSAAKKPTQKQPLPEPVKLPVKKQKVDESTNENPLQKVFSIKKPTEQDSSTLKFSSHTIILFDDVDTIFEQDDGFWSAVESVLTITKKPVIFTATRNLAQIRTKLPSGCPVAEFAHPKPDEVSKLAMHIFKTEALSLPVSDNISFLLQYYHCDVRKCVLQLQLDTALHMLGQSTEHAFCAKAVPVVEDLRKLLHSKVLDTRVITQRKFEELGLDITHLCLTDVLPLSTLPAAVPQEVDSDDDLNAVESSNALDSSWLSDEGSSDTRECKPLLDIGTKKEVHPQASLIRQCLYELAGMFDAFSAVDCLSGCLGRCAYNSSSVLPFDSVEAWRNGKTLAPSVDLGELPVPSAVSDALAYIKMGAVKLATSRLETSLDSTVCHVPELSMVVSPSVPNLCNIYQIAEKNGFWSKCCQQITDSGIPLSVVLNKRAVSDYIGALQVICKCEKHRRKLKAKRAQRFLHYLNSSGIFLQSHLIVALCKGFRP